MKSNNTKLGIAMAIFGPSLWGLMSIYVRQLMSVGITVPMIGSIRSLITGTVFIVILLFVKPSLLKVDFKGLLACAGYGIFSYGISYLCYAKSVELIPVAAATVIMFSCPIWVILINIFFFKDRADIFKISAVAICFIGAILVVDLIHLDTGGALSFTGVLCGIINAIGAATQLAIPRFFGGKLEKNTMIAYGYFFSGLALLPFMNIKDFAEIVTGADAAIAIKSFLLLSLLCTLVANYCYINSSTYLSTTLVSILSAFEVIVGGIVGVIVFNEQLSTLQTIGVAIMVFGALMPNILELYYEKKNNC